jgi:hypothetical protein
VSIKVYVFFAIAVLVMLLQGILLADVYFRAERHEKEAIQKAQAKAVAAADKRVADQKVADESLHKGEVDALSVQIGELRARLNMPVPHLRVCQPTQYTRAVPEPGGVPGGAQPTGPADPGNDSGVPVGSGGGDVGQGVRDLALAGELVAIYRGRAVDWALKQSH